MDELEHWSRYRQRATELRTNAASHPLLPIRSLLFEAAAHYETLALRVEALQGRKRCDRRTAVIIPFVLRENKARSD